MNIQFSTDKEFVAFKDELRKRLAERQSRDLEECGLRHAAVMMLIMNIKGTPHVLLTRRTNNVSTHKGQVAFPGGGVDSEDSDHLAAAYRETREEVGIEQNRIEYIGRFDDYISISGYHVICFIGAVEYPCAYALNEDETESVIEAPLSLFVNQEYEKVETVPYQGKGYRVFYYRYEGYEIWGLTARILTDFGEKICRD